MAVEKELLEGISLMTQGKEEGFNLLYSHTYNFVYARARAATKTDADAQDLTQETFLQAYKGITSLEDPNNVYAWLGGIVYRQGAKYYNKTRKELLLNEEQDYIFEEVETTDVESLPEENAQLKATSDVVMGMIEELPEAQRSAILSFYYDHMKIEEIANAFDCSVNTIKSRLNYAKKFLKSKIEEHQTRYSYKLYSLSPGILYFALRGLLGSDKYTMAPDTAEKVYRVACESLGFTASAVTAGTAATAAASTASSEAAVAATAGTQSLASVGTATATAAKSTGIFAKFAAFSVAKKAATVALAVSLLGGGATTAVLLSNQTPTPPAVTAPAETSTPVPTPPAPTAEVTPTVTEAVVEEVLPTEAPTPTLTPTPWPIYFAEVSFTPYSRDVINRYSDSMDMGYDYYYYDWFGSPASTAEDENFRYRIFSGYVSVCYKGGLGTKVEFPSEYNGMPVRAISKSWFDSPDNTVVNEELAKVEEVIIPDTVWCLGTNCFEKFTALKTITLSDTLQTIQAFAFTECAALQELDIPKTVRFIGNQVVSHCPSIQNVYIHSEDICIYPDAFTFSPIAEATYVPLEDDAPTIDDTTPEPEIPAEVPDSVDNPDWSFIDGTLTIKSGMQMKDYSIESSPWVAYRDRIEVLIIEDGVSYIGNYAFFFCDYIKELYIPGSVKVIGGYAFKYCRRLEKLELGEGVEVIGNAAFERTLSLTEAILPSTLKRIENAAFQDAQRLTDITFPEGLESITYSSFDRTPNAVKEKARELYNLIGEN